jgi:arabinogalactan oligomer/maltooligosaccharide transport system substrate-binding protein
MRVNPAGPRSTRLRRATVVAAFASVAALTLAGCSAAEKPEAGGDSGSAITLWVDTERAPALKDVTAAFKKDTGITVKLVIKDFATADQDFISQVPTGKGPDIIVSPHDKLGAYVANGVVAPIELGDKADLFAPSAVQAMTYDGTVYGVPYSIENVALVRNADLVPDASATFDEVIAKGSAWSKGAADTYPFLVGLSPEQGDPYHLYPLQTSFGAPVFGLDAKGGYDATKLELGNAGGLAFAAKLKEWGAAGVLNPNIDGDKAKEFFLAGKSPYYLTGPWNVPDIKDAGINYAIDELPSAGGQPAQPFIGVNGFFLSSKSKNELAATQFIVNYLSTDEAQTALYEVGGRPPAGIAAYEKAAADDADVAAFGAIGQKGVPMPSIPEMGAVWADWGNAELNLIKGEGDPATVWNTAVENIKAKIAG